MCVCCITTLVFIFNVIYVIFGKDASILLCHMMLILFKPLYYGGNLLYNVIMSVV